MIIQRLHEAAIICLAATSRAVLAFDTSGSWPHSPFVASNGAILNTVGEEVIYAGVNWPAHGETMVPEGLQYQSVKEIVSRIKSIGMNSIRLTFAVEMVDQIVANAGHDIGVEKSFVDALGQANGTAVYANFVRRNPSLASATRLQVFDAVAAECAQQQLYVHLDNHVSKAMWCCTMGDGNSWFGEKYFSVANWTRALTYIADHGKTRWPSFVSVGLRNELRPPLDDISLFRNTYNWQTWYKYIKEGARAVHSGNPDVLIFIPGVDGDTTVRPIVQGTALTPGHETFELREFAGYADKIVLELHNYANIIGSKAADDCSALAIELYDTGLATLYDAPNKFPLVLSEFGFDQAVWNHTFASCIEKTLASSGAGWMIWSLAGSYYVREGVQDMDDSWSLLTHDWSDWRSPEHIQSGLKPMIHTTLQAHGPSRVGPGGPGWPHDRIPPVRVHHRTTLNFVIFAILWASVLLYLLRSRGRPRRAVYFILGSAATAAILVALSFGSIHAFRIYLYTLALSADRG